MLQDIIQTTAALVTDLLKKFKQITKIIFISNQIKIWTIASLKQAIKCKSSTVKTVWRQKLQNGCPTWSVHNAHFHQNQQKIKLRMRKYKQTNKTALLWKKKYNGNNKSRRMSTQKRFFRYLCCKEEAITLILKLKRLIFCFTPKTNKIASTLLSEMVKFWKADWT